MVIQYIPVLTFDVDQAIAHFLQSGPVLNAVMKHQWKCVGEVCTISEETPVDGAAFAGRVKGDVNPDLGRKTARILDLIRCAITKYTRGSRPRLRRHQTNAMRSPQKRRDLQSPILAFTSISTLSSMSSPYSHVASAD